MIAYTRVPSDGRHVRIDGPNGGAVGCDLSAAHWEVTLDLPGSYSCALGGDPEPAPEGVEVVVGAPPTPADGWQVGNEVVIRVCCYAGPQWLFRVYRLVAGNPKGGSFSPVGRMAYEQRLY